MGPGIVPQIRDSNNVPVVNGVLCVNPIETTPQEANTLIHPTFTFLTQNHSIQMQHLLFIDQMVHSIYNPGFPDERKNDKYIVANICRGFSLDFPNGDEKLKFIRAMRQTSLEHHGAESPRTVGDVPVELWSGGKRKERNSS